MHTFLIALCLQCEDVKIFYWPHSKRASFVLTKPLLIKQSF